MLGSPQLTIIWLSWNSSWHSRSDWVWDAKWGAAPSFPASQAHLHTLQVELNSQLGFCCGRLKAFSDFVADFDPIPAEGWIHLADRQKLCAHYYPSQFSSLSWVEGQWEWIGWLCTSSFLSSGREAPWWILPSRISTSVLIVSTLWAVLHRRFCRRGPKHSHVAAQQRESSGLRCCLTFGCLRA